MKLVKQKDIAEERKCLFKQSENVETGMDSFLIPKFDSTPRSRSQSVELQEIPMTSSPEAGRKMSLITNAAQVPDVHVMIHPPSPVFHPKVDQDKAGRQGWSAINLGSPPAKKSSEVAFQYPSSTSVRLMPTNSEQLMREAHGPSITVTPMSELESDAETISNPATTTRMNYLSPFTIITTCASRTASESNLSSSGYSSMASPGPSRSGSSNPLCISESEDTSTPTRTTGTFFPRQTVSTGMLISPQEP